MSEMLNVANERHVPPLSAAVIAGGKSSRMGRDKALLTVSEHDPPMLQSVLETLHEVAAEVFIVDNDPVRYGHLGVPIVPDVHPGGGALLGIQSAIRHAMFQHCLVVACDMPFLNAALLARMAREPRSYDVLVPVLPGVSRQRGGCIYQTLHAIYSKDCAPAIQSRVERGELQVVGFFADVHVRELPAEVLAATDPGLLSFFNANTPEALQQARALRLAGEPRLRP